MTTDIEKLIIGTSEEDEEEDQDVEMDLKGEDDTAKAMVGVDIAVRSTSNENLLQHQLQMQEQMGNSGGGSRRCRPLEEKERTKLRERHRRAITARILAGLRRHGNYNLRVRADINDVIGALAREAGWVVLPDGTTFPSRSQGSKDGGGNSNAGASSSPQIAPQQAPSTSLGGVSSGYQNSTEYNICNMKGIFEPDSSHYNASSKNQQPQTPSILGDGQLLESRAFIGGCLDNSKQIVDMPPERDFVGTSFVPVYVMLPLGVINMKSELADPDGILKQLRMLKSVNVDGISVDCWWGIVEAHAPQEYNWNGYRRLFQMVHELNLKLQIVMSFHECGGNVGDDVCIPLPHWVAEIGRSNPDIFFTDRDERRNPECLSWGVDKERILKGRTAIEIYFDYMRSFRAEFNDYFENGIISMIEVGLGPCGELRYPSSPVKHGWRYPGIGSFQCYDQYMLKSLRKAAEARGQPFWGRGPDNTGSYNSKPQETGFFREGGEYDGYYGKFFLTWYTQMLIDHADRVLSLAKLAFEGTYLAAKLPGIHWWYRTASHAAELTAGYYNPSNKDGYAAIATVLKKHGAVLNFSGLQSPLHNQDDDLTEAMADPNGLAWQVLNAAWEASIPITSENSFSCHDRASFNKILDIAKPLNNPDGQHLLAFTYLRLNSHLFDSHNFVEFQLFVKKMHGVADVDVQQ